MTNPLLDIVRDTLQKGKQSIVFVESKLSAEKTAEDIARSLRTTNAVQPVHAALAEKILAHVGTATKQCKRLSICIKSGVAFHHAGLVSAQRELIEKAFREGTITTLCATPTLCLSKDTMIWHGMAETEVSTFGGSSPVFALLKNKLISLKPRNVQRTGNALKLIQISSASGYSIGVTAYHKMLVKRDTHRILVQASDIKLNDKIATVGRLVIEKTTSPSIKDFSNTKIEYQFDQSLSYTIGAMLGDGYSGAASTKDGLLFKSNPIIVGRDPEIFVVVKDVCKKIGIPTRPAVSSHGVPWLVLGKHNWFREFLVRCGVEQRQKKHINAKLMVMNLENTAALLRGLFDTDGYVHRGKCVGFSNVSETLVKQIQKLLLRFGIVCYLRKKKAGSMKIYEKTYKTLSCFELTLQQKMSVLEFYRCIGFHVERKQNTLLDLVSKIISNVNYVSCETCDYRIYKDLFFGRTNKQKKWGLVKLKVIKLLGDKRELASNSLRELIGQEPRLKGSRLNHHYEFIQKRKIGTLSKTEWFWSLNRIGRWVFDNLLFNNKNLLEFFKIRECPLCGKELEWVIKKGWRHSDFEGDIFWDKIQEIKEVDYNSDVYDVVLPDNPKNEHMFVANGFIVHNSYGVDTPAYRVILKSLKRYSGSWGMTWIPVLEYLQFCGRAGRPKFHDDHGEAIAIAKDEIEHDKIHAQYILGQPEDITSKLAAEPVLRTYVLSLVAAGFAASREQLVDFFSRTFWAHQYKDIMQLEKIIDKMLVLLSRWGFVKGMSEDFVRATDIGKNIIDVTPLGKRVAQLYLDPYTAHQLLLCMSKASAQPFGILQAISHTLEMRPLLRLRVKDHEQVQQSLLVHSDELLEMEPNLYDPTYDEFLESVKTALFFSEWIEEKTEEQLLEAYSIRPGEIQSKTNTADWLLYSLGELLPFIRAHHLIAEVKKLRVRVQYGAKEELLPLLRFKGIGRVRARRLYHNGLKDVGDLRKVEFNQLVRVIGKATAESVKKELGASTV